jgi:hypothetical protein
MIGKMRKNLVVSDGDSRNIIIFRDGKNNPKVEVLFHQNMLWLKQSQIAELFDVQIPAVSKHLKNIFEEGELLENSVISILETTASSDPNDYTYCDFGPVTIYGGGCETMSEKDSDYECDMDWGMLTNECGSKVGYTSPDAGCLETNLCWWLSN